MTMHEQSPTGWRPTKRSAALALLLLTPAPSIGVLVALLAPRGEDGQAAWWAQGVWAASKGWILLLPVLWHGLIDRRKPALPRPRWAGMPAALITGVLIFAIIAATYYTVGRRWFDPAIVAQRISEAGLDRLWLYVLMALYWCTINSLLEEYVWRWFVFTRCEALMQRHVAVAAAGLLFTVHHTIALSLFFGEARVVVLGSLGVLIGGATWTWLYLRWRNIYAAYVSHVFADLIIFWIGYEIVFG
jgi:membrane protease YdiL (CAAX protease family)